MGFLLRLMPLVEAATIIAHTSRPRKAVHAARHAMQRSER